MERLTLRDDDGRALLTPYGLRIYCSTQATADCICKLEEALKAQEPRVLTLEEALDAEYVYLDVRPHPSLQCECCILIKDEDGDIVPVNKGFWGSLEGEDYGTGWRCWTSSPTDEQREETPWQ